MYCKLVAPRQSLHRKGRKESEKSIRENLKGTWQFGEEGIQETQTTCAPATKASLFAFQ